MSEREKPNNQPEEIEIKTYDELDVRNRELSELERQAEVLQQEINLRQGEMSEKETELTELHGKIEQMLGEIKRNKEQHYGVLIEKPTKEGYEKWKDDRANAHSRDIANLAFGDSGYLRSLGIEAHDRFLKGIEEKYHDGNLSFEEWSKEMTDKENQILRDNQKKAERDIGRHEITLSELQSRVESAGAKLKELQVSLVELQENMSRYQAEITPIKRAKADFYKKKDAEQVAKEAADKQTAKAVQDFLTLRKANPGSAEAERYSTVRAEIHSFLFKAENRRETGEGVPAPENLKILEAVSDRGELHHGFSESLRQELTQKGVSAGEGGKIRKVDNSSAAFDQIKNFVDSGEKLDVILLDDEFFEMESDADNGAWESVEASQRFVEQFGELFLRLLVEKALGLSNKFDAIQNTKIVVLNASGERRSFAMNNPALKDLAHASGSIVAGEVVCSRDLSSRPLSKTVDSIKDFLVKRSLVRSPEQPGMKAEKPIKERRGRTLEDFTEEELLKRAGSKKEELKAYETAIAKEAAKKQPTSFLLAWEESAEKLRQELRKTEEEIQRRKGGKEGVDNS
ncbi:MAG: hypothetical protein UX09_C0001G0011 [Candidatus Uhrbacteria bacterium GW2011_GWE2_45_35]|uniref:Uncharacterized protein n=2 Tax=Candidatus Uhriibacteriota TaxID=1752732 RepID=A0A0G1JK79_9BACT|nr:MAG: hypothetical protein UW63_C0003G0003 [Candidatus Uhrbacteria bacterium GW2011_GWF2_44_350]KKU09217.1 MAG: hypothetical protein UX09_C0001G0011 [Candidatus Uhrbacteria bacterium GW2011_GWE2_45_35]HBR80500.1 hypothetical protein [Candidatus Uhrbacteria bacterium]HCU31515.1 hypothetical protein [Candidatus Uhrbacteria bacterium]